MVWEGTGRFKIRDVSRNDYKDFLIIIVSAPFIGHLSGISTVPNIFYTIA